MSRPLIAFALIAAGFALGGSTCQQQVVQDATLINGTLADPQVQAAITNIAALNVGVVCVLSAAAGVTSEVASVLKATATVNGAKIGAVATADLCLALGGAVPAVPKPAVAK